LQGGCGDFVEKLWDKVLKDSKDFSASAPKYSVESDRQLALFWATAQVEGGDSLVQKIPSASLLERMAEASKEIKTTDVSDRLKEVGGALESVGIEHELMTPIWKGVLSGDFSQLLPVDIMFSLPSGKKIAIEYNDKSSYVMQKETGEVGVEVMTGRTKHKSRMLEGLGYMHVSICWRDWVELGEDEGKRQKFINASLAKK
tara:strand:+ start:417 stop:1019 length:603 start_codon:yes stop_codon:yes gene_type:complete